jgi:hypothetical protein
MLVSIPVVPRIRYIPFSAEAVPAPDPYVNYHISSSYWQHDDDDDDQHTGAAVGAWRVIVR